MLERMEDKVVGAMFEAMPAEITVIDRNDEVVGWNKHETRLFKRPMTSMGVNFRQCHPEKSLSAVEKIVEEMKAGKRDSARFWIDLAAGPNREKHNEEMLAARFDFFAVVSDNSFLLPGI